MPRRDPEERCSTCGNWHFYRVLDSNGDCPKCRKSKLKQSALEVEQHILEEGN